MVSLHEIFGYCERWNLWLLWYISGWQNACVVVVENWPCSGGTVVDYVARFFGFPIYWWFFFFFFLVQWLVKFECLDLGFLGCTLLGFMGFDLFKSRFFSFLIKNLGFLECSFFSIVWLLRKSYQANIIFSFFWLGHELGPKVGWMGPAGFDGAILGVKKIPFIKWGEWKKACLLKPEPVLGFSNVIWDGTKRKIKTPTPMNLETLVNST